MNIQEMYIKMQKNWIEENNVKAGDTVRVLRTAKNGELGWLNVWGGQHMSETVGKNMIVYDDTGTIVSPGGIRLSGNKDYHLYPFYVLEKIKDAPAESYLMIEGKKIVLSEKSAQSIKDGLS